MTRSRRSRRPHEAATAAHRAALGDAAHVTAVSASGGADEWFGWFAASGEHRTWGPLRPGEWTIRADAPGYERGEARVTLSVSSPSIARIALRRK